MDASNSIKEENTTTPLVPQQRPVPAYDTRERRHATPDRHKSDRIHRTSRKRDAPRLDAVPSRQRRPQQLRLGLLDDLQDFSGRPRPEEFGPTFFSSGTTRDRVRAGEVEGPRLRREFDGNI